MSLSTIRGRDSKSRTGVPKLLTNSMEQRPSEGNSRSAGQEMSCILWKTQFLCHAYRSPPLVPVLHTTTNLRPPTIHFLFTFYPNISFPSVPRYIAFRFIWATFCMHIYMLHVLPTSPLLCPLY